MRRDYAWPGLGSSLPCLTLSRALLRLVSVPSRVPVTAPAPAGFQLVPGKEQQHGRCHRLQPTLKDKHRGAHHGDAGGKG